MITDQEEGSGHGHWHWAAPEVVLGSKWAVSQAYMSVSLQLRGSLETAMKEIMERISLSFTLRYD